MIPTDYFPSQNVTTFAEMAHPTDKEVYPEGTVVRIKRTGEFAIIRDHIYLSEGRNFLNYLAEIEGQKGLFALYHDAVELDHRPDTP